MFEPGTQWQYGVGIDWAGTIVERVSGMSLNEYFQNNIFEPLGIVNINMFPPQSMKDKLAYMHQRDSSGNIFQRNHLHRRPLMVDGEAKTQTYNSAGAGCYARPVEYCGMPSQKLSAMASSFNKISGYIDDNSRQKSSRHYSTPVPLHQPVSKSSSQKQSTRCLQTRYPTFRILAGRAYQQQGLS